MPKEIKELEAPVLVNIMSRVNHPVELVYKGECMILNPKQVVRNLEKDKISGLTNDVAVLQNA